MMLFRFILPLILIEYYIVSSQILLEENDVNPDEIANNPAIKDLLLFGGRYTVERGIQAHDLAVSNYQLTQIFSVSSYTYEEVDAITYKFYVQIANSEGALFYIIFQIFTLSETGIKYVDSYDYSNSNAQLFMTLYDGNTLGEFYFLPLNLDPELHKLVFVPLEFNITDNDEAELFGEYNFETDASGWIDLGIKHIKHDPEMQSILNFGAQEFLQREVDMMHIAGGKYNISHIYRVMRRFGESETEQGQIENSFEIELHKKAGRNVRANLIILSGASSGDDFELSAYTYMNLTHNANNFSDFELNSTEQAEYLQLDASAIENDQTIKEALHFGVKSLIYGGIHISRLPEDQYRLTQINSLYVNSDANYRFDVELSNCVGLKVRAVYIINLFEQENPLELMSLYFRIIDIPAEGLIGGNC